MTPTMEAFLLGCTLGVFACLFVEAVLLALIESVRGDE